MNGRVIVGYDGSQSSTEAVWWAAAEALRRDTSLLVVSCFEIPIMDSPSPGLTLNVYEVLEQRAKERLAIIATDLQREHPTLVFSTESTPSDPAAELMGQSAPGDLIVCGAGHHSGLAHFLFGSTARRLARESPCPLVVVKSAASRGRPDRVVVGVDGSPTSGLALAWACDEADRAGAELLVVHAWTYPYLPVDSQGSQARDLTQVDAACLLDASEQTARERVGVPVSGLLVEDTPVSALLGAVRDGDLLVLGRTGRGGLRELIIGSTTSNVMEHCVVPIAIIGAMRPDLDRGHEAPATIGSES